MADLNILCNFPSYGISINPEHPQLDDRHSQIKKHCKLVKFRPNS